MNWKNVAGHVGKVAPLLGSALGGPAGGAVGALISSALGVDDDPSAVSMALQSPDAAIKLKEIELAHRTRLEELLVEQAKSEIADTQHARASHRHSPMPAIICVALTFLVGAGAYLLFTVDIPDANREIAYLLFGTLLAKWGDSIAFWVGTTRSSAEKTRLMR